MACLTTLMWIPILDQGPSGKGLTTAAWVPPWEESLYGAALFCSSRFLGLGQDLVVPRRPHREEGDLPESGIRFSIRVVHTSGRSPHERVYRGPILLLSWWLCPMLQGLAAAPPDPLRPSAPVTGQALLQEICCSSWCSSLSSPTRTSGISGAMTWSRTPPLLCWSPQHQPVYGLDAAAPPALLSPAPLPWWPENQDFVDNTKLAVCHNPRIRRNKLFQGLAQRDGCTALGRFFGFKFHLPINHHGQIMAFKITGGNPDARQPLKPMTAALRGR